MDNIYDNKQFLQFANQTERDILQNRRDLGLLEKRMELVTKTLEQMSSLLQHLVSRQS